MNPPRALRAVALTTVALAALLVAGGGWQAGASPAPVATATWSNMGLYGATTPRFRPTMDGQYLLTGVSVNPGIWRTSLAGGVAAWTPVNATTGGETIDDNAEGVWTTEDAAGNPIAYANIGGLPYRSADDGATWSRVGGTTPLSGLHQGITSLVGADANLVVVAGLGKVWLIRDASGASGNAILLSDVVVGADNYGNVEFRNVAVGRFGGSLSVFLSFMSGPNARVLRGAVGDESTGATTWYDVTPAGLISAPDLGLGVAPQNSASGVRVWATGATGVWRSDDGGGSWSETPLTGAGAVYFDPNSTTALVGLNMTSDYTAASPSFGGFTGPFNASGNSVAYVSTTQVFASNDVGIVRVDTTNSANSATFNDGLEAVVVTGVSVDPDSSGASFAVSSKSGLAVTADAGANWTIPVAGAVDGGFAWSVEWVGGDVDRLFVGSSEVFAAPALGAADGSRYVDLNLRNTMLDPLAIGGQVRSLAYDAARGRLYAAVVRQAEGPNAASGGLFVYDGAAWSADATVINVPVGDVEVVGDVIYAVTGDGVNGGDTTVGKVYRGDLSSGAAVWQEITPSTAAAGSKFTSVAVAAADADLVFAAGSGGPGTAVKVYRSLDGGGTWEDVTPDGVPLGGSQSSNPIVPATADGSVVFAAIASTVYRTADAGGTWELFSSQNMGGEGILDLMVPQTSAPAGATSALEPAATAGKTLFAGTGVGVYSSSATPRSRLGAVTVKGGPAVLVKSTAAALSWRPVAGAQTYRIRVVKAAGKATCASPATASFGVKSTQSSTRLPAAVRSKLSKTALYFWCIRAERDGSATTNGAYVSPAHVVNLKAPANRAAVRPPAALSWSAVSGAAAYRVEVSTSKLFPAKTTLVFISTKTKASLPAGKFEAGVRYYWRVMPAGDRLGKVYGQPSPVREFRVR